MNSPSSSSPAPSPIAAYADALSVLVRAWPRPESLNRAAETLARVEGVDLAGVWLAARMSQAVGGGLVHAGGGGAHLAVVIDGLSEDCRIDAAAQGLGDTVSAAMQDENGAVIGRLAVFSRTRQGLASDWTGVLERLAADLAPLLLARELETAEQTRLRLSETRYREWFESISDGLLIIGPDFRVIDANPAVLGAVGVTMEQVANWSLFDFLAPADRDRARSEINTLEPGGYIQAEALVEVPDGRQFPVEYVTTPTATGGFVSVVRDISDRWRMQAALKASETRYRQLFEQSVTGIIVTDRDLNVVDVNRVIAERVGLEPNALIGLNARVMGDDVFRRTLDRIQREIAPEAPVSGEFTLTARSGEPVPVAFTTILTPDDLLVTFGRDLTRERRAEAEREAAEASRRAVEERNRELFERAPYGIAVLGDQGVIDANTALCEMMGRSREAVIGHRLRDFLEFPDWEAHAEAFASLVPGDRVSGEVRARHPDGTVRHVRFEAYSGFGGRHGCFIQDMTEQRAAERAERDAREQLARAGRISILGEMAASLAHELNQPLAALNANAAAGMNWLRREPPNLDEVRLSLERIGRDAMRASDVVARTRHLLTKSDVQRARQNLRQLLDHVLGLVAAEIRIAEVRVQVHAAVAEAMVDVDQVQIEQVLINLILNALESMRTVPHLERTLGLALSITDFDEVMVSVKDSGPGIGPADPEGLFEPFFTTKATGTGLGLAISRTIITAHGGRIWADPFTGRGARFHFTLPLAAGESAPAKPPVN